MKTIDIKGRPYVSVNERIMEFHRRYTNGSIFTSMVFNEGGVCIFMAIVTPDVEKEERAFTGHAYEKEGSTFINKTSYLENCETSAVGRALGMLGIGIDTSIASSDEVQNAVANQTGGFITENQLSEILDWISAKSVDTDKFMAYMKVETCDQILAKDFNKAIKALEGAKGEK